MSYKKLNNAYNDVVEKFQHLHELHEKVVDMDMSGELPEQELIFKHVRYNAKVLEFGGNIGRSSIVISKLLKNPQNHIVLESDPKIAKELIKNKINNNCGFIVINAALSETPIIQNGWTSKNITHTFTPLPKGWKYVPTITYQELLQKYPIQFDTIVADCEGCLEPIFKSYPYILDNIHTIIIENDAQFYNQKSNDYIQSFIKHKGFRSIECQDLDKRIKCFFQVYVR